MIGNTVGNNNKIAVVDYDMGNLRSVTKALEFVGATATATRDARVIADASHVVLPGVGAFRDCMRHLEEYGLIDPVLGAVRSGKPFLGICLGLQVLFEESTEFGTHEGLGLIKGRIKRFPAHMASDDSELKVPHMSWNSVKVKKDSRVLEGIPDGSFFYFVHSYYAAPEDESVTLTTTDYGVEFTSSIEVDNVTACQFHPEKSQRVGLKLLENFTRLK